jgi:opacity protein-like surface antigen
MEYFRREGMMKLAVAAVGLAILISAAAAGHAVESTSASMGARMSQMEGAVERMRTAYQESLSVLEEARKAQDVERLTAINEALTAIKGLLKHAEQNLLSLQEAYATGNQAAFDELALKIEVAAEKVQELKGQVLSSGGPGIEGGVEGKTESDVKVEGDSPLLDVDRALEQVSGDFGESSTDQSGGYEPSGDLSGAPEAVSPFL